MFIRWKKRPTQGYAGWYARRYSKGDILLSAFLVQSVRIDGKPRQKQQFLASIHLSGATGNYGGMDLSEWRSMHERAQFWGTIDRGLYQMKLDNSQIQYIRDKLAETVKPLTSEEKAEIEKDVQQGHPNPWRNPLRRRSATKSPQ